MTDLLPPRGSASANAGDRALDGSAEGDDGKPGADRVGALDRGAPGTCESPSPRSSPAESSWKPRSASTARSSARRCNRSRSRPCRPRFRVTPCSSSSRSSARSIPRPSAIEEAYGPPHYAAYVISKHARADSASISGPSRTSISSSFECASPCATPVTREVKARARALDERSMRPLRASLNGATRLLISPDGGLNLVPFEALVDEHGRYLIERYATSYLTSGRDLLRMQVPPAAPGKPVIVADPLFGEPVVPPRAACGPAPRMAFDRSRSDPMSPVCISLRCSGSALRSARDQGALPGGDAADRPSRDQGHARADDWRRASCTSPRMDSFSKTSVSAGRHRRVMAQNPLLRSGLALAGANLPGDAHGDGILTALEAAGLNLWGTSLVTLSACDTGVGRSGTAKASTVSAVRSCLPEPRRWS